MGVTQYFPGWRSKKRRNRRQPVQASLGTNLKPAMSEAELSAFIGFAAHAKSYVEFGAGGSTYIAAQLVKKQIVSVDSSEEWLDKVRAACAGDECGVKPTLLFADIGPTKKYGVPIQDPNRWPCYYETVWDEPGARSADLYLIDGRFRVACFVQTLFHCSQDALIMVHDFAERRQYHGIRSVAREIASFETLSVFTQRPDQCREQLSALLEKHRFDPD